MGIRKLRKTLTSCLLEWIQHGGTVEDANRNIIGGEPRRFPPRRRLSLKWKVLWWVFSRRPAFVSSFRLYFDASLRRPPASFLHLLSSNHAVRPALVPLDIIGEREPKSPHSKVPARVCQASRPETQCDTACRTLGWPGWLSATSQRAAAAILGYENALRRIDPDAASAMSGDIPVPCRFTVYDRSAPPHSLGRAYQRYTGEWFGFYTRVLRRFDLSVPREGAHEMW